MKAPALDSWLSARRLKTPSKTALVFDGESFTDRDLADRADAISRILAGRGIGRGDRVAFIGENSPEFLTALFGTVRLGAVFVPLNTRLAPPEIEYVVRDCGARVAIGGPEFVDRLQATGAEVISTDDLEDGGGTELSPDAVAELDDAGAIIYTSGTTGRPKGAILTHGNLTWAAINCIVDFDVISRDVALMISPMFHVAALGMGALPIILKGGTMVLEKKFEPGRALELIAEHKVSMLAGVPTTFQLMCDHPDWDATDLSSMRILTCGGSAVPTRALNAYEDRGLGFSQGYGMTETSPGATTLAGDFTRVKQGSVGVPHFFTRVRVVAEDGRPAAVGEVGEIEVFGPNVLLRPRVGDRGVVLARRMVPLGRPRFLRRRRLPVDLGPPQRHDHLRWRERLPGRDREPHQRPRRRDRGGRDRRSGRALGRGAVGRGDGARRRRGRYGGRACGVGRQDRAIQDPRGDGRD